MKNWTVIIYYADYFETIKPLDEKEVDLITNSYQRKFGVIKWKVILHENDKFIFSHSCDCSKYEKDI